MSGELMKSRNDLVSLKNDSVEYYEIIDSYNGVSGMNILSYDNPLARIDLYQMPPLVFKDEVI